jgi:O-antigen/teichoic acid export membrane protein
MAASIFFAYANAATSNVLFSINLESVCLRNMAWSVVFVVAINAALIPRLGHVGASLTTLLPEVFLFALQHAALRRRFPDLPVLPLMGKFALTGGAIGWLVAFHLPFGVPARAAVLCALYAGGLWITRIFDDAELSIFRGRLFQNKRGVVHV